MPDTHGNIIDDEPIIRSDVDSGVSSAHGNASGLREPEIINGFEAINPSTERIAGTGDTGGKRKRGRPAGSRNSIGGTREEKSGNLSSIKLEDMLYSLHVMGAEFFRTPELELDKGESSKLSEAIQEVAKFHNVTFDPKKVALFNLAMIAGGLYGVRFVAIRRRLKEESKNARPVLVQRPQPQAQQPQNGAPNPLFSPSQVMGDQGAGLE